MVKLFRILAALALFPGVAFAQTQVGAGQIWGNPTAAKAPLAPSTVTAILDQALGSTRGAILERGASGWAIVGPSSTAGLPWVSAGAGADPVYGIAVLAGGGTGAALTASNGGIFYSTGSAGAILAGTATARLPLLSGASTTPVWGAFTLPSSVTSGGVAYFSSTSSMASTALGSSTNILHGGAAPTFGAITAADVPYMDTNTLNSVTANYTIAASDCGKTIQAGTGSTGLFTLTLPAVAGFNASCTINIKNGNSGTTGRGQTLVGFPTDLSTVLWPTQAVTLKIINGVWATTSNPGRWKLPTSRELCTRQDGAVLTDGLGNGTVAADCFSTIQAAVVAIGTQWDGNGYNACSIGLYAGGTSIFNEAVAQTGQSIGCYLTYNIRGAVTWTSATNCLNSGDNAITIINWNLGFIPTFKCNTGNTLGYGAFYCHQTCIYDFNGGTAIWIPGGVEGLGTGGTKGTNDVFFYVDLQGSASYNAQVNVGNGIDTYNPLAFTYCEGHCSQVTLSGTVASSALVTWQKALVLQVGSLITHTLSWPGASVTSATTVKGAAILVQSSTVPGPAATATSPGVICSTKAC
jgi:hypothetical protein